MYNIDFTSYALEDLAKLKKSEPKAFKKVTKLIEELRTHKVLIQGGWQPERWTPEMIETAIRLLKKWN